MKKERGQNSEATLACQQLNAIFSIYKMRINSNSVSSTNVSFPLKSSYKSPLSFCQFKASAVK